MRINANKKIHKMKRDPFRTLLRMAGILAIVVAVSVAVLFLSASVVNNDYIATRNRIQEENAEGEVKFNAEMNALRNASQSGGGLSDSGVISSADLPSWEATLDGSTWRIEDNGSIGLENTYTITLDRASLMNGGLLLVNAWHSLPSDFSEDGLINIGTASPYKIPVDDNSVRLFQPAYEALGQALEAAKAEGIEYFIVREGYRSVASQEALFNDRMQKLESKYSGNRLIEETKKSVNYPGTSDYHTGLSFRMDVYKSGDSELNKQKFQAESKQGAWLTENCWKYGIVFRFPTKDFPNASWEDKSYKTGVSAELNLYRYVGKAHAAAMKVMGFCLEEYIEFLMDHPHISIYQDGAMKYEIVRIKGADASQSYSLPVPNLASDYQGSLDNMDGVVMAYSY